MSTDIDRRCPTHRSFGGASGFLARPPGTWLALQEGIPGSQFRLSFSKGDRMLAKVPSVDSEQDIPAARRFTATLDPNPAPGATNQIALIDADDNPFRNPIWAEDGQGLTRVSITLTNATFSSSPIDWPNVPGIAGSAPTQSFDGNTLTLEFQQPANTLAPFAFRIVVDTPDVKGIRSQIIYLAKRIPDSETLTLDYKPSNGTFMIREADTDEGGIDLGGDELILINVVTPRTLSLQLPPSTNSIAPIRFAQRPVVFIPDSPAPSWIEATLKDGNRTEVQISIQPAPGQSTGLKFVLEITLENGTTTTVLSPDPILINATIGDG
jgi:hypothetical protein